MFCIFDTLTVLATLQTFFVQHLVRFVANLPFQKRFNYPFVSFLPLLSRFKVQWFYLIGNRILALIVSGMLIYLRFSYLIGIYCVPLPTLLRMQGIRVWVLSKSILSEIQAIQRLYGALSCIGIGFVLGRWLLYGSYMGLNWVIGYLDIRDCIGHGLDYGSTGFGYPCRVSLTYCYEGIV